jgi:hypothetical protein
MFHTSSDHDQERKEQEQEPEEFPNHFIEEAEWSKLFELSAMRMANSPKFEDVAFHILNDDGVPESQKQHLQNLLDVQQGIVNQIQALLQRSQRYFQTDLQLDVLAKAQNCVSFLPGKAQRGDRCIFTGKTKPLIRMVFVTLHMGTGELVSSKPYPMEVLYGTMLRAWNLVANWHSFMCRVPQLRNITNNSKAHAEADHIARELPEAVNHCAKFLFHFCSKEPEELCLPRCGCQVLH